MNNNRKRLMLLDVDLHLVFGSLKIPEEEVEIRDKLVKYIRDHVSKTAELVNWSFHHTECNGVLLKLRDDSFPAVPEGGSIPFLVPELSQEKIG